MPAPTHYEILGVDPRATAADLLLAFRRGAMRCHPDRNPDGEAHAAFVALADAYRVLGNEAQRADYDRVAIGVAEKTRRASTAPRHVDRHAMAERPAWDCEPAPGEVPAAAPARRREPARMRTLRLTAAEMAGGARRILEFAWIAACGACDGAGVDGAVSVACRPCQSTGRSFATGYSESCAPCAGTGIAAPRPCTACAGTGRAACREEVVVVVPAGISPGSTLTLANGRPDPRHPGRRCDLAVRVEQEEDVEGRAAA